MVNRMKRSMLRSILSTGLLVSGSAIDSMDQVAIAQTPDHTSAPSIAPTSSADELLEKGIQQYESKHNEAALQTLNQALALYRSQKNRNGERRSLANLGLLYTALKNYPKALELQKESLALAIELKNRRAEGQAQVDLASIYFELKNYAQAIEWGKQSLAIAQEIKNREDEAYAAETLGLAHDEFYWENMRRYRQTYTGGQFDITVGYFTQSLQGWRELNKRSDEGRLLRIIARTHYDQRLYQKCIQYYEQALPIVRDLKQREVEGIALSYLGRCHESMRNHEQAIEAQSQSLSIAQALKTRRNEAIAAIDLGKSYFSVKNYPQAKQFSELGLQIARELKNESLEESALSTLGKVYEALKDYPKAIVTHNQRLELSRRLALPENEADTWENLGSTYARLRDWTQSLEFYQKAFKYYLGTEPILDKPLSYFAHSRGVDLSRVWFAMGNVSQDSGDHRKAIEFYKQYIKINGGIEDDRGWELKERLASSLAQLGQMSEAEKLLKAVIDSAEGLRGIEDFPDKAKLHFGERQAQPNRLLQKILIQQNKIEEALQIAEYGRSRTLVELLAKRLGNYSKDEVNRKFVWRPESDAIRKIARSQKVTLVEYSIVSSEELYIWVVKPSGEIIFRTSKLTPMRSMEQLIAESRSSIAVVHSDSTHHLSTPEFDQILRTMHQMLIEPIAADLPKDPDEQVIFVPQGELFLVPFPALKDAQGRYLIEQHTISTTPSIQTLQLTREKMQQMNDNGDQMLIVGDPAMPTLNGLKLEPLPGARREAIAIASLFETPPLLGEQATKAAVLEKMKKASIIHLATHGLLHSRKDEIPGAIVLAPSDKDDGLLTASELFNLQLKADLAVLSACDTGLGDIKGDGVIGLSRSLIAAGVPSVMVSLWKVNDQSTSFLMREFYQSFIHNLPIYMKDYTPKSTTGNYAASLRSAMLKTMKQYPNPKYWAAFTLVGERHFNPF